MNMLNASVYDQLVNPTPTISYYFLSWQQPASAIGQTENQAEQNSCTSQPLDMQSK